MSDKNPPLVWIDMEMSGLDADSDVVLEIATLITDENLKIIAEGPELVVHQSDEVLENMSEWCIKHHGDSGLTQRCRESQVSVEEAERLTLEFILAHCQPGQSPLCGNSVGQDRLFLLKYMPKIVDALHYRIVDVSSVKELAYRWYDDVPPFYKQTSHRALEDIRESIEELKFYRRKVFRKATGTESE